MYVVVGLGNPGKQYENTRHNIGFIAIDYLADKLGVKVNKIKHKALIGESSVNGEKIVLVKPQTYMNLSGESVRELMNYYKVPIENLIVIYDDIDTDVGKLRIRKKGSAGTHNGMKSIIYQIRDDNFVRFRIGVGKNNNIPLDRYVLSGFQKDEVSKLEEVVDRTYLAILETINTDIDMAMNRYNG
ncbi:MAG: aminoacyl-tRNA hydrolase [Eubacteriales bacterium]|nr:aminoacyl-tRNA hydrolase [Eubacteriales bacterium]MDY3332908.1 aminoacyl-tRNA hydrolase [Gallibacter sp.]